MPKSRRGGLKYHLRRITAQLYALPLSDNNLLGVDYYSDCDTIDMQNLQVTRSINFIRYVLTPIEVTIAAIHPSAIPVDDMRYAAYTLAQRRPSLYDKNKG